MTNPTIELGRVLACVSPNDSISLPLSPWPMQTQVQREQVWLYKNREWIYTRGMLHYSNLDILDPIAVEFMNLDSVQTHLKQLELHLFLLKKLYDILVLIGFSEIVEILPRSNLSFHDYSKCLILEIAGYAERWGMESKGSLFWKTALNHHMISNPHHIGTFWGNKHHLSKVDVHGIYQVSECFLLESILDGISRTIEKRPMITLGEIFDQNREREFVSNIRVDLEDSNGEQALVERYFRKISSLIRNSHLSMRYFDRYL